MPIEHDKDDEKDGAEDDDDIEGEIEYSDPYDGTDINIPGDEPVEYEELDDDEDEDDDDDE